MYVLTILIICIVLGKECVALDQIKICAEESTNEKNPVVWPITPGLGSRVASVPLCISESQELVTRMCNQSGWHPKHDYVPDCFTTQSKSSSVQCPPTFTTNDSGDRKYCYNLQEASGWDYPCFDSGSSMTVFDLDSEDLEALISKLNLTDRKLVWLPAKRVMPYGPIVWTLPGDMWGEQFEMNERYTLRDPVAQTCLLVELDTYSVKTENCSYKFPTLCLSEEKHLLPLHCPEGYQAAKYGLNDGLCYGLERKEEGATWQQFLETTCPEPVRITDKLENYLMVELADNFDYEMEEYCWTGLIRNNWFKWYPDTPLSFINWSSLTNFTETSKVRGVINEENEWLLLDENTSLTCMACQIAVEVPEPEISLHLTSDSDTIHLIIYNPSSLWKKYPADPGVNCFTNTNGFITKIDIVEKPYRRVKLRFNEDTDSERAYDIEKTVHELKRISDYSGEYWCEGHSTPNFTPIQSTKLLIPSLRLDRHTFVLKLKIFNLCSDISTCKPNWYLESENIEHILNVKEAIMMKIDNIDSNAVIDATLHISVKLIDSGICNEDYCAIHKTFTFLLEMCETLFSNLESYEFISIKSTEYCLPDEDSEAHALHWELTPIGEHVAPKEFCMQSNGLPVTRQCLGSFIEGAYWGPVMGNCSENFEPTNRTAFLYSLAKGRADMSRTSSFLTHDLVPMLDDKDDLIPADVYFLAMSMKTIVDISDTNDSLIELGDILNIALAIDSFMDIEASYLNLAQTMNSTNVFLESVDEILTKIASNGSDFMAGNDPGIDIAVTPNFITQISSPHINNISGLALARRSGSNSTLFTDLDIIPLTTNMSIFDVLSIPNLEIATWLSQDLLNSINALKNSTNNSTETCTINPKIIIEVFYSDVVFQETKQERDLVNSRVISVTVPGFESDLPLPLRMLYRRFDKNASTERACAYWDFGSRYYSDGQWAKQGCFLLGSHDELDVCACFHLTHFAQLILGARFTGNNSGDVIILYYHGRALNAITLVGCSLSLIGVAGIAATAILFPSWRQKAGSKVLLQLSAAIALQSIMMVSQDALPETDSQCVALGALLHYSVLAAFMWMLLTALLQFTRYVKVLGAQRPARFLIKFSLAGWGLPIIPVAALLIASPSAYLPPQVVSPVTGLLTRDTTSLCYPQGLNLYLTVLLPVGCIVVTNLIVFVLVMWSIIRSTGGMPRRIDSEVVLSQLRLSVLLFFLLGLSWIFGLLAITGGEILFSYLFCLTATLQGFVLFVYFILCDPATRVLWVSLVRERSKSSMKEVSG